MTFKKQPINSTNGRAIHVSRGDPDCLAFYKWIHSELSAATLHWPPNITALTTGRMGNLGEFLSFKIARDIGLHGKTNGFTVAIMGALTPLQDGAPTGLDTTIVYLDPAGDASKDRLLIMEVKTTGGVELTYARALIADYEKLLGQTKFAGSLAQRMNWLQGYLMDVHEFTPDQLDRVGNLFMPQPQDCERVRLMPTLVHDRQPGDSAALVALDEVAEEIENLGWPKDSIEPWSIAITRLTKCFIALSNNDAAFRP